MDKQQAAELQRAQKKMQSLRPMHLVRFFGEVKQEFKRIDWPKGDSLKGSAKSVLGWMLLAGFVTYGVDLLLERFVSVLEALARQLS